MNNGIDQTESPVIEIISKHERAIFLLQLLSCENISSELRLKAEEKLLNIIDGCF